METVHVALEHPSTPYFSSLFFKTFVTHPLNINELVTFVTRTPVLRPWQPSKIWNVHMDNYTMGDQSWT